MRVGTLAGAASLTMLLVGLVVAPTAQARAGLIVGEKSIDLLFPDPGFYIGTVKAGKVKVKRAATRKGKKESRQGQLKVLARARRLCNEVTQLESVTVVHLSKPPFTIGVDAEPDRVGDRAARYAVSGAQPPTGEPVLAQQDRFQYYLTVYGEGHAAGKYAWKVICQGAKDIKPYPY